VSQCSIGCLISIICSTSLNTSLPHSHLPERSHFFARKSNPVNQIFVKYAWGWTSLVYLLHLASSPPARTSRRSRLAVWLLATMIWLGFTTWFFGAGLGDRIIALSGGSCAVALPREWDLHLGREGIKKILPNIMTSMDMVSVSVSGSDSDQLYLPVPHALCSLRQPLTPKNHPELFSLLSSTSIPTDSLQPTTSHPALTLSLPNPRWHRGFDISGHAFLLTMSTLVLARELTPSWQGENTRIRPVGRAGGAGKWVHGTATVLGTALVGLWIWMVGMTAVWFHNPPEKVSGLGESAMFSFLLNLEFSVPE